MSQKDLMQVPVALDITRINGISLLSLIGAADMLVKLNII
jgi:hypothetical protein